MFYNYSNYVLIISPSNHYSQISDAHQGFKTVKALI